MFFGRGAGVSEQQADLDEATQNGLFDLIEKISILAVISEAEDPDAVVRSLYSHGNPKVAVRGLHGAHCARGT